MNDAPPRAAATVNLLALMMVGCGIAALPARFARAQTGEYPDKPVRVIVPFPPGGGVDVIARLVAPKLSENMGRQLVIDNRGGASGNIGTEMAARAVPDGYTLLMHTLPFVTNTFLYSKTPYNVLNDFSPVSLMSSTPSLLAVHPSTPVRSVRELLELARARPGILNYATAGIGTNPHIAGELLNYLGKVNIVPVHFKGGGPALIATIGGEIEIITSIVPEIAPHVKTGRLRALGVTGVKRSAAMPDVPSIAEAGLPGYEFVTWHGMLAPANTPRAIVALLNDKLVKTMRSADVSHTLEDKGLEIIASSPEQFSIHLKRELEKWSKIVRDRKLRAE